MYKYVYNIIVTIFKYLPMSSMIEQKWHNESEEIQPSQSNFSDIEATFFDTHGEGLKKTFTSGVLESYCSLNTTFEEYKEKFSSKRPEILKDNIKIFDDLVTSLFSAQDVVSVWIFARDPNAIKDVEWVIASLEKIKLESRDDIQIADLDTRLQNRQGLLLYTNKRIDFNELQIRARQSTSSVDSIDHNEIKVLESSLWSEEVIEESSEVMLLNSLKSMNEELVTVVYANVLLERMNTALEDHKKELLKALPRDFDTKILDEKHDQVYQVLNPKRGIVNNVKILINQWDIWSIINKEQLQNTLDWYTLYVEELRDVM